MKVQAAVEPSRCPRDGYLVNREGECWFCGRKYSGDRLRLVSANHQPTVEVEMSVTEQLLLSEEIFERYAVPSVKVTLSGTIDIPLDVLQEMAGGGFEPGDAVAVAFRGHVLDVSAPYDPAKDDHKGRLVVKAEVLSGMARMVP
jgi:hypothetical protein